MPPSTTVKIEPSRTLETVVRDLRVHVDNLKRGTSGEGTHKIRGHKTPEKHTEDIDALAGQVHEIWSVLREVTRGLNASNRAFNNLIQKGLKIPATPGGGPTPTPPANLVDQLLDIFRGTGSGRRGRGGGGGIAGKIGQAGQTLAERGAVKGGVAGGAMNVGGTALAIVAMIPAIVRGVLGAMSSVFNFPKELGTFIQDANEGMTSYKFAQEVIRGGEDPSHIAKMNRVSRAWSFTSQNESDMRDLFLQQGREYHSMMPGQFDRAGGMGIFLRNNLKRRELGLRGEYGFSRGPYDDGNGNPVFDEVENRFGPQNIEKAKRRNRQKTGPEETGGDTSGIPEDERDRLTRELAEEATIIRQAEGARIDQKLHPRATLESLDKDVTEELKEITTGKDRT